MNEQGTRRRYQSPALNGQSTPVYTTQRTRLNLEFGFSIYQTTETLKQITN